MMNTADAPSLRLEDTTGREDNQNAQPNDGEEEHRQAKRRTLVNIAANYEHGRLLLNEVQQLLGLDDETLNDFGDEFMDSFEVHCELVDSFCADLQKWLELYSKLIEACDGYEGGEEGDGGEGDEVDEGYESDDGGEGYEGDDGGEGSGDLNTANSQN